MIGNYDFIQVSRRVWILLVFMALSIIVAGPAHAGLACNACHTMPPSDTASERNPATGAFKGNHQGHSGNTVESCVPCHGANVSSYSPSHRGTGSEAVIKLTPALNNYSIGHAKATYSRGTFFNQTSIPPNPLGTCSNVNCHFETITPAWGVTNFASPTDCNKCHGAAPADGTHPKHTTTYYGTPATTNSCVKCHSDHTVEAKPFAHATSAGNRGLVVSFAATPNNGFGRYTGNVSYPKYLPSQGSARNGTCKSTYCHSPGDKAAASASVPNQTAQWGGSLTCKGCHKSDFASGSAMASGSHNMHITGNYNPFGYNLMTCVKCHATTATAALTIANTSRHVNGQVEIAFDSTSSAANGSYKGVLATPASPMVQAPGATTGGACTNVYCHSSGQSATGTWPPTYQSPQWGNGPTGKCGTCHGESVNGGTHGGFSLGTPLTTGSHTKHFQYQMNITNSDYVRCVACHAYTRTGLDPAGCNSGLCHPPTNKNHANYSIDVVMPDYFGASATYNGSSKPGNGYSTCSNVYCHSDGQATPVSYYTPTWGTPSTGACGTCHGANAASPPASARHAKHVGSSSPYEYACALCHAGIVKHNANSTTYAVISTATTIGAFDGSRLHVNKSRDVKFDAFNPFGNYSSYNQSCNSAYCHSIGNIKIPASRLPGAYNGKNYAKVKWTDAGPLGCNACHGRSTPGSGVTYGMPDYVSGKQGSMSSNSHPKHVSSSAIACVECHEKTTKNNTSIRSTFPSTHVNGSNLNVYFNLSGNSKLGAYDNILRTCTTTYCHGAVASPAWGGSTQCNSCHSASPGLATGNDRYWNAFSSAHKQHVEVNTLPTAYSGVAAANNSSPTQYNFACTSCHSDTRGATHVNGMVSATQAAQVFFGFTSTGLNGTYTPGGSARGSKDNGFLWTAGSCSNTYCHSDGNGGGPKVANFNWGTPNNTLRCFGCHGSQDWKQSSAQPAYSSIRTQAHARHVRGDINTELNKGNGLDCYRCHGKTVNAALNSYSTTGAGVLNKKNHINKMRDYSGLSSNPNGGSASAGTFNSASHACSNVYCHSNSKAGVAGYQLYANPDAWNSGVANKKCNYCHGRENNGTQYDNNAAFSRYTSTGVPNYLSGAAGSAVANSHRKHVAVLGTTNYSDTNMCYTCHSATLDSTTGISASAAKFRAYSSRHTNGGYNIKFKASVPGTYNGGVGVKTCSNTYCHSNGTSVATGVIPANTSVNWGTAGPLPCTSCHGAGGTTGAPYYSKLMRTPTAQSGATWTTPGDALLGNKTFASYAGTAQGTLILTNFGYTAAQVADTDTVTGITVVVEGWAAGTGTNAQLNVQLTQDGTAGVGTAKTISLPGTTSAANAEVYATTTVTDLWGTAWTPAQVRATTFGVILKDNDATSSQLNVDLVRVIIHTSSDPKMNNHSSAIGHRLATCDICHTSVTYSVGVYTPIVTLHDTGSYNVQASLGYTFATNGGTCATPGNGCHGPTAAKWGGTLGCVDCHNKTITRTKGRAAGTTLANVVSEFGLAWGHKKSGRNPVTDDDCIVCHLEGDGTTHKASKYHQDGNIDLRDPNGAGETPITNISGGAFTFVRFSTSYAAGSRTSTGQSANTIDNVITQKFCLACHDSTGASNPTARSNNGGTGTATMPFGGIAVGLAANYTNANGSIGTQGLVDVKTQFATSNSSKHPVLGPLNRDFATTARLSDPYKPTGTRGTGGTLSLGVVINCFDCHNVVGTPRTLRTVVAHGNAVTIRGVATVSGTPSTTNKVTFCVVCHTGYDANTTDDHGTGSAWSVNIGKGFNAYMRYGCNMCHSSGYTATVPRPVRAQDTHGVNVLGTIGTLSAVNARWATDPRPYAFIRNRGALGNHQPKKIGATAYTTQCSMPGTGSDSSPCSGQGTALNYSVGGTY